MNFIIVGMAVMMLGLVFFTGGVLETFNKKLNIPVGYRIETANLNSSHFYFTNGDGDKVEPSPVLIFTKVEDKEK